MTARKHAVVSCLWFAYNVQWGALLPVLLPVQIAAIVGDAHKELYNGLIPPLGAVFSLLITPLAGALSDRRTSPTGRRRPFLIAGALWNCAFLLSMATFGAGSNVWVYAACYFGVQCGANWWGGPYAGLIPDVVAREERGSASGWMMFMTAAGTIVGAVMAGQFVHRGFWVPYVFIAATILGCLALTITGVQEPAFEAAEEEPLDIGGLARSFLEPLRHRPDFVWVLVTRTLVSMGMFSVYTFFVYFLKDIVRVQDAEQTGSALLGGAAIIGMPFALIAGRLSDRWGRKAIVKATGALMAMTCGIYGVIAYHPSWPASITIAILFGIGSCAYQAVDWALALDVLPNLDTAGKDMGVWHTALVLPQVIAPFVTGVVLNAVKPLSPEHGLQYAYMSAFLIAALWFALGTVFVNRIRGVR
ncbi:MAG TPA: MFS transporter [Bryobacteraceae bacterium]|jgi:MFS family permease